MSRVLALLVVCAALAGACTSTSDAGGGSSSGSGGSRASSNPSISPANLAEASVRLEQIAMLEQPVALAVRPGDPRLYVAEKVGRVVALREGDARPEVVLDLTQEVSLGSEQGLLGLAFSPDGNYLYIDYTDTNGDTRIVEFAMTGAEVDVSSRREILFVAQPFSNHNGGQLAFGPDGYLYVGLGDGGSGGDPNGNGQSLSTLLGKILRISPRPSGGKPYGIPPNNPFTGQADARPEVWAYGLRNPWRFSFDRQTGDLWIGDVGQDAWEEIDLEAAGSKGGLDFGWNLFEGSHPFARDGDGVEVVMPVYEYPHGDGVCAVTGGYVYRGSQIPALDGAYVFADFCAARVEAFTLVDGRATPPVELGPVVENLASFGEDASGELYVLSLSGPVYRLVPL